MPEAVYRATPVATAVYDSTYDVALQKRKEAIEKFLAKHDLPRDTDTYALDEGTGTVVGIRRDGTIPQGWRTDRKQPEALVPNRRTKPGKQIAEDLAAIPHANARKILPGNMPEYCITNHVLMHCSIEHLQGTLFVGWTRKLPAHIDGLLDKTVWQQVPLSAYHLAREETPDE